MSKNTTVGFRQQKLPLWLALPNRLSKYVDFINPKLTPEQLIKQAGKKTGLSPVFSAQTEEGLEVLCKSLQDEAALNWLGKMNYMNMIVTGLSELLQLNEIFRLDPKLARQKLNKPIFVTGMPRSGTTFLHRLLSTSDQTAPVLLCEHMFPTASNKTKALWETKLLFFPWEKASQRYQMDAIHFMRAELADECNFGMRLGMQSMIYSTMSQVPSYMNWLLEQNMEESYQIYRKVLQLHQSKQPKKQFILKCPHHLAALSALSKVFPESAIVQTHREPAQVIASECKLNLSIQALSTDKLNCEAVVKNTWQKAKILTSRSIDFANAQPSKQLVHVDYKQLVKAPIQLAKEIYTQLEISGFEQQKFDHFFNENKQHKHGKNVYSLEQFGLTQDTVDKEFGAYRERFIHNLS